MSPSRSAWGIAIAIAIMAHVALFAGIRVDDGAKIERSAGVDIAVGSLSSFVEDISQDTSSEAEVVETAEPADELEAEQPPEVETEPPLPETSVSEIEPTPVENIETEVPEDLSPKPTVAEAKPVVSAAMAEPPKDVPETHQEVQPDTIATAIATTETTEPVPTIKPEIVQIAALEPPKDLSPEPEVKKIEPVKPVVEVVPKKMPRKKKPKAKKKPKKKKAKKTRAKPTKKPTKTRKKAGGSRTAAARRGAGGGGRQNAVSGTASITNFKGKVRARVARRVRRSSGRLGRVVVRFTVTQGGGVAGSRIISSTDSKLNRLALAAVRGGFPAIPPGLPRKITFTVPIRFK